MGPGLQLSPRVPARSHPPSTRSSTLLAGSSTWRKKAPQGGECRHPHPCGGVNLAASGKKGGPWGGWRVARRSWGHLSASSCSCSPCCPMHREVGPVGNSSRILAGPKMLTDHMPDVLMRVLDPWCPTGPPRFLPRPRRLQCGPGMIRPTELLGPWTPLGFLRGQ